MQWYFGIPKKMDCQVVQESCPRIPPVCINIWLPQFLSVQQAGAGGWSWNGVREKHCYLAGAGGRSWNDVRKKYCTAGAPAEQPNTVKGTK